MKKILFFLALLLVVGNSQKAISQSIDHSNLESKIDALIPSDVQDSTPGLVVGIVQNGDLIFSKGYGMANLSYEMSNDPNMLYNIGSVTKQFLGYAFAMLHIKGALDIDKPVYTYLKDWPQFNHEVTLRHLLTHSSGYREAYTMSNLAGRNIGVDRLSREECLNVVKRQPELEFIPGSRHTYNSTAWVILAEVLKEVTGIPADEWVSKNIFEPLKMNDTQIESYVGDVISNAAESYSIRGDNYVNEKSNRAIFGAADIWTNIPDLAKWIKNLQTAEVGGKEVQNLFLESFILNDGTNSEYALGIGVSTYKGVKRYRHTGGHESFSTQLSYFPEHETGIITISNFGGRGWLETSRIADILLEEHLKEDIATTLNPIKLSTDKLQKFTGDFVQKTNNGAISLSIKNDTLTTSNGTKLIPTGKSSFGIEGWTGKIEFSTDSASKLNLKVIDGRTTTYTKAESWSPSVSDLKEFEGSYYSEELETTYKLSVKNDQLTIEHRWVGELPLDVLAKDFFRRGGYFVKFLRNNDGAVSGLSVNSGRTLNVIFKKINK